MTALNDDNTINEKTEVSYSIQKIVYIMIFIISCVAGVVLGYAKIVNNQETIEIQLDNKLDKSVFHKHQFQDSLTDAYERQKLNDKLDLLLMHNKIKYTETK